MFKPAFLLLLLFVSDIAFPQKICGKVISAATLRLLPMVRVDFVLGNDTIYTTYTNSVGEFEYCDMQKNGRLSVQIDKKGYSSRREEFQLDSLISEYVIDFKMYKLCDLQVCPSAIFEIGEHRKIQQLEIESLTALLAEYPAVCLKTVVGLYPGESEKLAEKRMRTFRKILVENSIDIRRINFSAEYLYTRPPEEFRDMDALPCNYLPNISFVVQSMHCD